MRIKKEMKRWARIHLTAQYITYDHYKCAWCESQEKRSLLRFSGL